LSHGRTPQEIFPQGRFDIGNKLSENRRGFTSHDRRLRICGRDYLGLRGEGYRRLGGRRERGRDRLGSASIRQESIAQRSFQVGNEFFQNSGSGFSNRRVHYRAGPCLDWGFRDHRNLLDDRTHWDNRRRDNVGGHFGGRWWDRDRRFDDWCFFKLDFDGWNIVSREFFD
jgi:hypothetical protein